MHGDSSELRPSGGVLDRIRWQSGDGRPAMKDAPRTALWKFRARRSPLLLRQQKRSQLLLLIGG
jgi:hypothetical protein